jgi:hypothetical protein
MADAQQSGEPVAELDKQVKLMQQQLAVLKAQLDLDATTRTVEAQLAEKTADALKAQLTSEFDLASLQAKMPFAELQGVKAGLAGLQLPAGKAGTLQVDAGKAETALLRTHLPLLQQLEAIADHLTDKVLNGQKAVLVTDARVAEAYQAQVLADSIKTVTCQLKQAIDAAAPKRAPAGPAAMAVVPSVMAAGYAVGMVADMVNSLGKLFRVDRTMSVYSDSQVIDLLGVLLEGRESVTVVRDTLPPSAIGIAKTLTADLTALALESQRAADRLEELKTLQEAEAKNRPAASALPDAARIATLKSLMDAAKAITDGLDLVKKSDAFWKQVRGQATYALLKGSNLLFLEGTGQSLRITESRWWTSDHMVTGGEAQVSYRLVDSGGTLLASGILLRATAPTRDMLGKVSYSSKK